MSKFLNVRFFTDGPDAATTFVEEYVLDATDRLSDSDVCESFMFAPAPNPETGDRSVVNLTLEGDVDELLDSEQTRWEALVEDGPVTDWKVRGVMDHEHMAERLGEGGAALKSRLNRLSVEMAKLAYEEFDDFGRFPDAVETFPDEDRTLDVPMGWWVVLHHVTVQLDYSLDEELDAFVYGIEHTLRNVAEFEGAEEADARLDELLDTLEGKRSELRNGRLKP